MPPLSQKHVSIVWKTPRNILPLCGKIIKTSFHCVENPLKHASIVWKTLFFHPHPTPSHQSHPSHPFPLLCSLWLILLALPAQAEVSDPAGLFAEATAAYDAGDFQTAAHDFAALAADGQDLPAVRYNLANALYRTGQTGPAILHYLRARRDAPRDPDIRANLELAARSASVPLPAPGTLENALAAFAPAEWKTLAVAAAWLLLLLLAVHLVRPRWTPYLRTPALAVAALLLLALLRLGWMAWTDARTPLCVLLTPAQTLSAPLDNATPLAALPEGLPLRRLATHGHWAQIQTPDNQIGWIPAASLRPVSAPVSTN